MADLGKIESLSLCRMMVTLNMDSSGVETLTANEQEFLVKKFTMDELKKAEFYEHNLDLDRLNYGVISLLPKGKSLWQRLLWDKYVKNSTLGQVNKKQGGRLCCVLDVSNYLIGLRWRTEKDVISGKGQFICGNRHGDEKHGLGKKIAYKSLKEKEKEEEDPYGEKEIELKDRDKRKRYLKFLFLSNPDEAKKDRRKKKDRKGASRSSANNEEGFEEFLEGMFP
ncbi:hypothetical protein VPH35_070212 [Triticum aestivum]